MMSHTGLTRQILRIMQQRTKQTHYTISSIDHSQVRQYIIHHPLLHKCSQFKQVSNLTYALLLTSQETKRRNALIIQVKYRV